jgi:hypothetical protein
MRFALFDAELPNPVKNTIATCTPYVSTALARFPARWNHLAEKDSRQINMLEQILIAKVFNFGGICSRTGQ